MKTIKDLKEMIKQPASKEWFAKHGPAKKLTMEDIKTKAKAKSPERFSHASAESRRKAMNVHMKEHPVKPLSHSEERAHQKRTGRAYSE